MVSKVFHRNADPCWLQCFPQLCKAGWISFGWLTILDTHGELLSEKTQQLCSTWHTQSGAPGTYYHTPIKRHFNLLSPSSTLTDLNLTGDINKGSCFVHSVYVNVYTATVFTQVPISISQTSLDRSIQSHLLEQPGHLVLQFLDTLFIVWVCCCTIASRCSPTWLWNLGPSDWIWGPHWAPCPLAQLLQHLVNMESGGRAVNPSLWGHLMLRY